MNCLLVFQSLLSSDEQVDVPRPLTNISPARIKSARTESKGIAETILSFRSLVVEVQSPDPGENQTRKLIRRRDAIMVAVAPQLKPLEHSVICVDSSIAVPTILGSVIDGQSAESIPLGEQAGLRRNITEQFPRTVDAAVSVEAEG